MDYKNIILEEEESWIMVTLNRPPANQLNRGLVSELDSVLNLYESNDKFKSIIIKGAGDKIFCAGADISEGFGTSEEARELLRLFQDTFNKIERYKKVVIAAMNGHALGGGCELAMSCHLRLLKEGSTIGLVESNLGIIPGAGGTQRMPRLIGKTKALEYMIFGKRLSSEEALNCGLINSISTDVVADAVELAKKISKRAPLATQLIIDSVNSGEDRPIQQGLDVERENFIKVWQTEDAKEGISAFFQKREANFKGK